MPLRYLTACALVLLLGMENASGFGRDGSGGGTRSLLMEAQVTGDNPFRPGSNASFPARIHLQGPRLRIDVTGPEGQRVMLLRDDSVAAAWLVSLDEGLALPTDARGLGELFVDPEHPCEHLRVRCAPAGTRFVAGKSATGWRFRDARGRGPAGTSDGEFWIHPEEGVVVAYRGTRRGRDDTLSMEARSVSTAPLPEELFDLPEVVGLPKPAGR